MSTHPKVSIIIPVYNVEQYIARCAHSLFGQTLDDIEYIFVNDCTPDKSMDVMLEVLELYPHRKPQVRIINFPENRKVAAARTAGMKAATGEYMIHCDPDDWVELNAYELMYNKAIETGADIVTCQLYQHKNTDCIAVQTTRFSGAGHDCLRNLKFDWYLFLKLIRSNIIFQNRIYPYENINCGEDLNVIVRLLYFTNKIEFISAPLYHYNRENENSITHTPIKKILSQNAVENMKKISGFLKSMNFQDEFRIMNSLKYSQKSPLIWSKTKLSYSDAKFWVRLWPESNPSFKYRHPLVLFLFHKYLKYRKVLNC